MPQKNPLDRRVEMLTDRLTEKMNRTTRYLTEPKPYNMRKVPEEAQVRKFLQARDTGALMDLRAHMGDEAVNDYVKSMTGRAQKYLNLLAERELTNATEVPEEVQERQSGESVATYYTADDDLESF